MLLFAVGQQALSMLLLLLFLQLPGLQGLETSDGVTEPKVNGFTLARMDSNIIFVCISGISCGPIWLLCKDWGVKGL